MSKASELIYDEVWARSEAARLTDEQIIKFIYAPNSDNLTKAIRSRLADRIEALEAREARLSEALREIAYGESRIVGELVTIARAALNGSGSGWRDGLSTWAGWDQSREHWGETKHKDAVLEAMFRGPWSAEDADALIGFIDRTWTKRPAAPQQGGE